MAHHGQRPVTMLHLQIQLVLVACLLCSLVSSSTTGTHSTTGTAAVPVPCLPDQASALLQLKRSFIPTDCSVVAFRSWRIGTDCCRWRGVSCGDDDGRVTSLDLGDSSLYSGHLDAAVFELSSLRYLNLGGNDFNLSALPPVGFERLTKLTNLNLSSCNFGPGRVPQGIGRLANLISLDLSARLGIDYTPGVGLHYWAQADGSYITLPNLTALVANLGSLRELHLGFVDMSQSTDWCEALAKHTPDLRVLSLPFCFVSGPICGSISALHSLSVIDLQFNDLTGSIPDFLANFSFLNVLRLSYNNLQGWVSPAIFQHKKLVTIDLQQNEISGSLPNFTADSCLQNLLVGQTSLSGTIPDSIGNLKYLTKLGINALGLSGNLPSSIGKLKSLNDLRVSGIDLVGPIPSWIANLTSLEVLEFSDCGLYGSIPSYLGGLSKLEILALYNCKFSGHLPPQVSNFTQVRTLVLASNNFTGTVELNSVLSKLPNLTVLNLSNNKLVVVDGEADNSSMVSYPNIIGLYLASCNINSFPSILRHLNGIQALDLSNNQIHGAIPQWLWENLSNFEINLLDVSHNNLTDIGYETFLPICTDYLDLSYNMFEGDNPLTPSWMWI